MSVDAGWPCLWLAFCAGCWQIEDKIGDKVTEYHYMEIVNTIKDLGGNEHALNGIAYSLIN